jgi:hypothetical protein
LDNIIYALIPILAIICIFGLPMWSYHQRRMLELKMMAGSTADSGLVSELQALAQQVAELRDTTTRYDMSFDSALQRIESRVGHLEGRVNSIEAGESRPAIHELR